MKLLKLTGVVAALGMMTSAAQASLISVTGPNSSAGTAAQIIAAPASVTNSTVFNSGTQGFDEQQGVVLTSNLAVNGGVIAAGTRVDSHMIFLNKEDGVQGLLSHENVEWTFSGDILGVMIDVNGVQEAVSTAILGAIGTTYATFNNRGLEGADNVSIAGAVLTTNFFVTQPGDWIRVITASEVPLPAALPLMLAGLAGLGGLSRRRKKSA